jgi:hypothetical protein
LSYREDRNTREFNAALTDSAMNGLGEVLGDFFVQRAAQQTAHSNRHFSRGPEFHDNRALPSDTTPILPPPDKEIVDNSPSSTLAATPSNANDKDQIVKILAIKDNSLELIDNRLKGTNFSDFAKRLTYLALYAREISGQSSTREAEVIQLLKSAKVWDRAGNVNRWLNKRIGIASEGEENIKLTAPGREDAIRFLGEVLDSKVEDKWNPDRYTPKPRGPRKKKKA